jgi:hypothetical protein
MSDLRTARAAADPREHFARQFFRVVNPLARRPDDVRRGPDR